MHQRMDSETDGFVIVNHDDAGLGNRDAAYLGEIGDYIESIADALWPVNKKIHDNPELNYKEFIAHEALTKFMKTQSGWKVTPSAYGLETAWIAVYDSGKKGPIISFNVEMGKPQ